MRRLIVGAFLIVPQLLSAQSTDRFQQEYFFGRLPSVKTEAMGRADVAVGGSVSSLFFNPAGIGSIESQEFVMSTSAPYYALPNADYYFFGFARRFKGRYVGAASIQRFGIGETTFTINILGQDYEVQNPTVTNIALSGAGEVIDGLHAGVNLNIFRWNLFDDASTASALHFDIGAIYTRVLSASQGQHREVRAGISVTNMLQKDLSFEAPDGASTSNTLPSIARIGASYVFDRNVAIPGAGTAPLRVISTLEFQDVLTNESRTAIRFGTETLLYDVIAIRIGAFTQNIDGGGFENNKSRIGDITYGAGLVVPIAKLTDGRFPVNAHLDYMSLEQPSFVKSGTRLPNMRGFGLRLVWTTSEDVN